MTNTTKTLGTGSITIQAYPNVIWAYETAEDVIGAIEYMEKDAVYLEKALAEYTAAGNAFMVAKVTESAANSRRLIRMLKSKLQFRVAFTAWDNVNGNVCKTTASTRWFDDEDAARACEYPGAGMMMKAMSQPDARIVIRVRPE